MGEGVPLIYNYVSISTRALGYLRQQAPKSEACWSSYSEWGLTVTWIRME